MATAEEIAHRVAESDTARTARRSSVAKNVGELAGRQAVVAEELRRIEDQLGAAVVAAQEVMEIKELARFTDVRVKDLIRWSAAQKPTRGRRKQAVLTDEKTLGRTTARTSRPMPGSASTVPQLAAETAPAAVS